MREGFRSGITFFLGKPFTVERAVRMFRALRAANLKEKGLYPRFPLLQSKLAKLRAEASLGALSPRHFRGLQARHPRRSWPPDSRHPSRPIV